MAAIPAWGEIVSRGNAETAYSDNCVEVTRIIYQGWTNWQVAWDPNASPEDILTVIKSLIPATAVLRRTDLTSEVLDCEGIRELMDLGLTYIQWEPVKEEVTLARAS